MLIHITRGFKYSFHNYTTISPQLKFGLKLICDGEKSSKLESKERYMLRSEIVDKIYAFAGKGVSALLSFCIAVQEIQRPAESVELHSTSFELINNIKCA